MGRGASPPRCTSTRSRWRSATRPSGCGSVSEPADASLIPDFSHLDVGAPGVLSKRDWMVLDVDYRLMADNLLDLSHVNFLHDGLLGHSGMVDADVVIEEDGDTLVVTRTSDGVVPPKLFDLMYRNDGEPVDTWAEMRWNAPGCLRNHAGVCPPGGARDDGMTVIGTHLLTPIGAHAVLLPHRRRAARRPATGRHRGRGGRAAQPAASLRLRGAGPADGGGPAAGLRPRRRPRRAEAGDAQHRHRADPGAPHPPPPDRSRGHAGRRLRRSVPA